MTDTSRMRPKNVVVVDAENPLVEVRGEFFWREDHEMLLAAAREQAFRHGFREGYASGRMPAALQRVVLRTRPRGGWLTRLLLSMLVASFLLSVVLTAVQALSRL
jgi:hypothetical protein